MPYAQDYTAAAALKLINQSEHLAVRGGVRGTAAAMGVDDDKVAHTISRHLLKGSPGALGQGVASDTFRDRFLDSPDTKNSGWAGKGEMALLLCEALNSEIGQHALRQLDKGIGRVMIHYLNLGKLALITGKVKLKESSYNVTPARDIVTLVPIMNTRTNTPILDKTGTPRTRPETKTIPRSVVGKVTAQDIASVNAVLDRFAGGELHLQTFFPSTESKESYAEWTLGMVKITAAFERGALLSKASVNLR